MGKEATSNGKANKGVQPKASRPGAFPQSNSSLDDNRSMAASIAEKVANEKGTQAPVRSATKLGRKLVQERAEEKAGKKQVGSATEPRKELVQEGVQDTNGDGDKPLRSATLLGRKLVEQRARARAAQTLETEQKLPDSPHAKELTRAEKEQMKLDAAKQNKQSGTTESQQAPKAAPQLSRAEKEQMKLDAAKQNKQSGTAGAQSASPKTAPQLSRVEKEQMKLDAAKQNKPSGTAGAQSASPKTAPQLSRVEKEQMKLDAAKQNKQSATTGDQQASPVAVPKLSRVEKEQMKLDAAKQNKQSATTGDQPMGASSPPVAGAVASLPTDDAIAQTEQTERAAALSSHATTVETAHTNAARVQLGENAGTLALEHAAYMEAAMARKNESFAGSARQTASFVARQSIESEKMRISCEDEESNVTAPRQVTVRQTSTPGAVMVPGINDVPVDDSDDDTDFDIEALGLEETEEVPGFPDIESGVDTDQGEAGAFQDFTEHGKEKDKMYDNEGEIHLVEAELVEPEDKPEIFDAEEVTIEKPPTSSFRKFYWAGACLALTLAVILILQFTVLGNDDSPVVENSPTSAPTYPPGSSWMKIAADIYGEGVRDASGTSIELSNNGKVAAIGAPGNHGENGVYSGHVRIFGWSGTAWGQLGQDLDGYEEGAQSAGPGGVALSGDGKTVAFSSYKFNDEVGKTMIFHWSDELRQWVKHGSDIDGLNPDDEDGIAIALSDDGLVLAISARDKSGTESVFGPGRVRIFAWDNEQNDWAQRGDTIAARNDFEQVGDSVALAADGSTVAVSAPLGGGTTPDDATGETRVYSWNGSSWIQKGDDIPGSSPTPKSLCLSDSGTTVATVVQSPSGVESSFVQVLTWDDAAKTWTRKGEKLYEGDIARRSISLSADGNKIAASEDGSDLGSAMVHEWVDGAWEVQGRSVEGNYDEEHFGYSVSLSGDGNVLAVSAPNSGINTGDNLLKTVGRVAIYAFPQDEEQ